MKLIHKIIAGVSAATIVVALYGAFRKSYVVIVLGNNTKQHALYRVKLAEEVVNTYNVSKVVFTGGAPHGTLDGKSEADYMADNFHTTQNVVVLRETKASDTKTNLLNVIKYLKQGEPVIVVSDHDHVISAAWCMQHVYGHPAKFVYGKGGNVSNDGYFTSGIGKVLAIDPPVGKQWCKRAGCCK